MKRIRMRCLVALGALATLILAGCGGSGGGSSNLPDPTVRFINGSPNDTGLDFLLNDDVKAANIAFGAGSPDFQSIEYISANDEGYDISVRPDGGEELDRFGTVFNRDTHNLVVALGLHDPGIEFDKRLQLFVYQVLRTPLTGTRARVYVINGFMRQTGFDTPNVTFQNISPGDPAPYSNPSIKTTDMSFGTIRHLQIDADTYDFIVRRSDTDALVQYASTTVALASGKIYIAVITGQEGAPTPFLQPKIVFIELSSVSP